MALKYHKSIADTGGAIGAEIDQTANALLPTIKLTTAQGFPNQEDGAIIERKFYISNDSIVDEIISDFSLNDATPFSAILFESTGDAQVVGDLTGSEVDESPITVTIPALGHKSFWVRLTVPALSTITANYGNIRVKTTEG